MQTAKVCLQRAPVELSDGSRNDHNGTGGQLDHEGVQVVGV